MSVFIICIKNDGWLISMLMFCSDEAGVAAYKSVELDDSLGK